MKFLCPLKSLDLAEHLELMMMCVIIGKGTSHCLKENSQQTKQMCDNLVSISVSASASDASFVSPTVEYRLSISILKFHSLFQTGGASFYVLWEESNKTMTMNLWLARPRFARKACNDRLHTKFRVDQTCCKMMPCSFVLNSQRVVSAMMDWDVKSWRSPYNILWIVVVNKQKTWIV